MIYLFYGTDVAKTRAKAFAWVAAARVKDPDLTYVRLSREDVTTAALENAALSTGLFTKRLLVLIDDPFASMQKKESEQDENEDGSEDLADSVLEKYLEPLAVSDNAILILAPKLTTAKARKLGAQTTLEYVFDLPPREAALRGFNGNLVNAFAEKNREKLWLEINRALRLGDAPEMLHGLLQWKTRDLASKGGGRVWKSEESRRLSLALITLLQDSRRGGLNLALSLERFALSI